VPSYVAINNSETPSAAMCNEIEEGKRGFLRYVLNRAESKMYHNKEGIIHSCSPPPLHSYR